MQKYGQVRLEIMWDGNGYILQEVLKIKVNITWKIHMICCHLETQLTRLGRGLAIVCEQAGEAVHSKLKKTEAR